MMRDRLIELLKSKSCRENLCMGKNCADCEYITIFEGDAEKIVDYLLANGVIVLPCKVGDVVYIIEDWGYKKELKEKEIGVIVIKGVNDFSKELWEDVYGGVIGTFADFGKTVFLTREEAEKVLNNVGNGNS